jgi:hypothetical protein
VSQGKRTDPFDRRAGYTPSTWRMLDADISGDAALLLLRLRRLADRDETDGFIELRDLAALAAFHQLNKRRVSSCLAELLVAGLLEKQGEFYIDVEFSIVCRSHSQREDERKRWRLNKESQRSKPNVNSDSPMSPVDSARTPEGHPRESPRTAAAAPSTAHSPAAANELPADFEEDMPNQLDVILLSNTWREVSGKTATLGDAKRFAWWLDQYGDRLAPDLLTSEMRRLWTRQIERNDPIKGTSYFDDAIRELHEQSAPRRHDPPPRGEGEPDEEPNGDRPLSPEQARRLVAALAADKAL